MSSSQRTIPIAEDRISALPDSLLFHILSFLPTELVVATRVLSKRWRPMWRSVLTLDFDDESFKDFGSFRYFVYSVIFSRDPMLPLRSFRIKCGQSRNFDPQDLNRFIHAAVQRGLEIFDLNVSAYDLNSDLIPSILRVFSCRTLVVLKLANLEVHSVPDLVDFPLLRTLHLELVAFETPYYMNFVRGCSLVEDLHIDNVEVDDGYINSAIEFEGFPKLLRAYICHSEESFECFPLVWLHNAKFLCAKLGSFSDYLVPTFPNLTHMELHFENDSDSSWPGNSELVQVLHHCPKLQNLIIDEDFSDTYVGGPENWKDPEIVPECLRSQLRTCCLRNFKGYHQWELHFAKYIMLNSKLLCTMKIENNYLLDGNAIREQFVKLSSYPRGSATCKLVFD